MRELWPHQKRALAEVHDAVKCGKTGPLVVIPTGGGKTTTGAEFIRQRTADGGHGLWIAHREELVDQAKAALVGVERVFVRSIQSLHASGIPIPGITDIVLDECHHSVAPSWMGVIQGYPGKVRLGLTATPERADGQALGNVFDALVVPTSIKELTSLGVLVPCRVIAPDALMPPGKIAMSPLDAYKTHASGRKCMVFAPHVDAAKEYTQNFLDAGYRAAYVTGACLDRSDTVAAYKRGKLDVLVNIFVLTEGFDDPSSEVAILARRVGSTSLLRQMTGRILRASPETGKTEALFIDLPGVTHIHGEPDEELIFSLDGRGVRRAVQAINVRFCQVCGNVMESNMTLCNDCGVSRPELQMPIVLYKALVRFQRFSGDTADQQAAYLAKKINEGRGKGYHTQWAHRLFKYKYGKTASKYVTQLAIEMARSPHK